MEHALEELTDREEEAKNSFAQELARGIFNIKQRKTEEPVLVAFIGSTGSGKGVVAKELAEYIGATVIKNDAVCAELRKQREPYEHAYLIAESIAFGFLENRRNIILDFDFADEDRQSSLREKARKADVRLIFIRTYCGNEGGSKWESKKLSVALFADIDTTDPDSWEREVEACAKQLLPS